jgi:hypothetical protein
MKLIIKAAAIGAGIIALSACNNTPADNAADNVQEAADNVADNLDAMADNATNDATADALENQADATRAAGENKADAIEDNASANGQ